jgi:phosphosulfolactate synthase
MHTPVDERFSKLIGSRPSKPRESGQTMVIGDGLYNLGGMNYLEDLVSFAGPWIDSYKFQRGALALQSPDLVQSKLELLAENDVLAFPGGNFLEAAVHEGVEAEWLESVREVGCPGVEVSTTSIAMALERKAALVERAVEMGFHVHVEIGKKASETGGEMLSEAEVRDEMEAAFDAGAGMVILEMEQIEQVRESGGGDRSAAEIVTAYAEDYGRDRILFEVPLTTYYDVMESSWWFMDAVGRDVNLGNVHPEHVLPVEQQRRGLGQYAFSADYVE